MSENAATEPQRVYISASWKQRVRVRALAADLRSHGHQVYDFTDSSSREGVLGEVVSVGSNRQANRSGGISSDLYREYLHSVPDWLRAVRQNQLALRWCAACVLLLPAGADSHADWALAVGLGKRVAVVGHPGAGERTPSHLWADVLLERDDQVLPWLRRVSLSYAGSADHRGDGS